MPFTLMFLAALCSIAAAQAVEVAEQWQRGGAGELMKLQTTLSNVVTINLVWRNKACELYERTLSSNETRRVASQVKEFSLTSNASGDFGKERIVGVFLIQHAGEEKAQVQLEIAESGRGFVAFHTAKSYDAKRRCFEFQGGSEWVRELVRQPGSRKKETPKLALPPPR